MTPLPSRAQSLVKHTSTGFPSQQMHFRTISAGWTVSTIKRPTQHRERLTWVLPTHFSTRNLTSRTGPQECDVKYSVISPMIKPPTVPLITHTKASEAPVWMSDPSIALITNLHVKARRHPQDIGKIVGMDSFHCQGILLPKHSRTSTTTV